MAKTNSRRVPRTRWAAMVSAAGAVIVLAGACTPPPPATFSLAGEELISVPPATIIAGNCDPAGDSTFTVEAIGQATGPFPGTFIETITVTIGPQTEEHQPGQFRGDITTFESTVEITSPAGNVQATTTLDLDEMAVGVCSTSQVASWTIAGQIVGNADYEGQKGAAVASGESSFGFNMYDGDCSCSGSSPDFYHDFYPPAAP